ncbi:MAG: excinuclease ABC subunit UvrA, partial [Verrucomicrobiota bacterium]
MPSDKQKFIRIKGARQHNLKNLDVLIPRHKLVVVTGLSGSGKSSLAFDTLFAEGQRKYVESLSAYARQFLDQMQKPDVDYIEGLSPAIAIEQRSSGANPRSTIATTTEIYDYLRLLYSAVGVPHDPTTGQKVSRQTPQEIADAILRWPEGTKFLVLAPLVSGQLGEFRDVIEKARREGFVRVRVDGEVIELTKPEGIKLDKASRHTIEAVIDRLAIRDGLAQRLADSIETALRWGGGRLSTSRQEPGNAKWIEEKFSTDYCNPETGFTMPKLTPKHFSFNSHLGACPVCHGIGTELYFDPDLMVDAEKTLAQGAVRPWKSTNKRMRAYYASLLQGLLADTPVPVNAPWGELPESFRELVLFGSRDRGVAISTGAGRVVTKPFEGVVAQARRLYETSQSEFSKKRLRAFQGRRVCGTCGGARLIPEILAVTITGADDREFGIETLCSLSIEEAGEVLGRLALSPSQEEIVKDVLREVRQRLHFLNEVGLDYLQLNRESGTLSGGEAQRIRLATQIGSGLSGVLYVLDEPSIGLHQRDNDRLIQTLRNLRDLGNSVIVVEHDEDTIRAADHILDLGPGAGPRGGQLVAQGSLEEILRNEQSLTAQYLNGTIRIPVPRHRTAPRTTGAEPGDVGDGWLR